MRFFLFALLLSPVFLSARTIRVATYNVALSQSSENVLSSSLRTGTFAPALSVAEVIQIMQPDVLLINEFDFDAFGTGATRLNDRFFNVSQNGRPAQDYPYRYVAESNTGLPSGFDLDNNGVTDTTPGDDSYGGDALGFGQFPGQFGMAVFSKFPILTEEIRNFQEILWRDQPDNIIPPDFYSAEELAIFRLSSKSHWDLPIQVEGTTFHFLVSHPTPPVFDGAEDRNGRRNHDEIRLWSDYLTPGSAAYLGGGLPTGKRFVIAGDQNADPSRGDSVNAAINQLLDHPRINSSFIPQRTGARTNTNQFDTATFGLRVDYVLPSSLGFVVSDGAVFWPTGAQEGADLVTVSDHRLVYLDLTLVPLIDEVVRGIHVKNELDRVYISWEGESNILYQLEKTNNLADPNWERTPDKSTIDQGGRHTFEVPPESDSTYYRIVASYLL